MSLQERRTPPHADILSNEKLIEYGQHSLTDSESLGNLARYISLLAGIIEPPPNRNAAEWAKQCRELPPGSAMPGPFRPEITPYMIPISEAIERPETRWATVMMGSQMGKTEGCFNIVGKKLDDDPEPILYVGPTQKNIQEKIEPRIMQMIDSAAELSKKMLRGKRSTKTCKRIAGVTLNLAWAGSATELASQPAAMVLVDELDRMRDIKGEGSVIEIVAARMATYADSVGVIDSTPTVGSVETEILETGFEHWAVGKAENIASPVWQVWQEGSREEWAVPCPECGEHFIPRFKLLWWPQDCSPIQALDEARLTCSNCGIQIDDSHRHWMNSRGVFVGPGQKVVDGKAVGDLINVTSRSWWVSGLMSPFVSFGERAHDWIKASRAKDQGRIQGVINTRFGELYNISGEAPEWEVVAACRQEYESGTVPWQVQRIYCTVDVQGDRLIYVIRGWGYNFESWGIEKGEIRGDTKLSDDKCWEQLEVLLDRDFGGARIDAMAIDSGFNTAAVDKFARRFKSRVFAVVGRDNRSKAWTPIPQDEDPTGRKLKFGYVRWTLDHGYFKKLVHERIAWDQDQRGAWHIPEDFDDDYCKQIVAETRIRMASGREKWVQVSRDNHYLDCEYLQFFLAQVKRVQDLKEPEEKTGKKKSGGKTLAQIAEELNEQ